MADTKSGARGLTPLRDDFESLIAARRRMLELELGLAAAQVRRLAIAAAVAGVVAVCGLALLADVAATRFAAWAGLSPSSGRLVAGGTLVLLAAILGAWAWARFRRNFRPLPASREELAEDLEWITEWVARSGFDRGGERRDG